MRKHLVAGLALSAASGVLASVGVASASTLEVDGGIIQYWELPALVEGIAGPGTTRSSTAYPEPASISGEAPLAPRAPVEPAGPATQVPGSAPADQPSAPADEPRAPAVPGGNDDTGGTGSTLDPAPPPPDEPVDGTDDGPVDGPGDAPDDAAPSSPTP